MLTIVAATTPEDLECVRSLLRLYAAELPEHRGAEAALADVDHVPGPYRPPNGGLYLARLDGAPAGCVALAPWDASTAEVRRMFVLARARRRGVGRALLARLLDDARGAGYRTLRLGTLDEMEAAQRLYAELGFVRIPDYRPNETVDTVFFECDLTARPTPRPNPHAVRREEP